MEDISVTEVINALEESMREPVPMSIWYQDELAEERRANMLTAERNRGVLYFIIMAEAWIAAVALVVGFAIWVGRGIALGGWRWFL